VAANVAETRIAHHGAGKQAGFEKNLKAVADAENHAAGLGEFFHGLHHRGKPRNGPGAEVIPVGKPARQDNRIAIGKVLRLVPNELDRFFQDAAYGVERVVIAVGARKNNYSKFHALVAPSGILGKLILAHQRGEFRRSGHTPETASYSAAYPSQSKI
jgi:hypothetical protein